MTILPGDAPMSLIHQGSGRYNYAAGATYEQVRGRESRTPFLVGREGNNHRQGSSSTFEVPVWVPDDPYPEANLDEDNVADTINAELQGTPVSLTLTVRQAATADSFLANVARETPVFALISHFSLHSVDVTPPETQATGLCLHDFAILAPVSELLSHIGACYPAKPVTRRTRIDVGSRLLFVAGCNVGPIMKSLLDIGDTTKGRALVFAKTAAPRLHVGAAALGRILKEWRGSDITIREAVERVNAYIRANFTNNLYGPKEQYDVAGDQSLKGR